MLVKTYFLRFEGTGSEGRTGHWRVVKLRPFKCLVKAVDTLCDEIESLGVSNVNLIDIRRIK